MENWLLTSKHSEKAEFETGDYFAVNEQIYRIIFVASLTGIETTKCFVCIDCDGFANDAAETIEELLSKKSQEGVVVKVAPISGTLGVRKFVIV